jgi:hypothetical protein
MFVGLLRSARKLSHALLVLLLLLDDHIRRRVYELLYE